MAVAQPGVAAQQELGNVDCGKIKKGMLTVEKKEGNVDWKKNKMVQPSPS